MNQIKPIILAGGSGTRLWPLSRSQFPKQFLPLCGEQTMLQQTLHRLEGIAHSAPLVICNQDHRFIVAEQLRQQGRSDAHILLEPIGRNTAPAIALAAFHAMSTGEDPILLVLAADHHMQDVPGFVSAVQQASHQASQGKLVTFGITPTYAETGYGYIEQGEEIAEQAYRIARFVEKPDATTAQTYLAAGRYLWNSGMFMMRASVYLAELQKFRADIYQACQQAWQAQQPMMEFLTVDKAAFAACPEDSIDWAVMEKTDLGVVVPLTAGWSDVGGFAALWTVNPKDAQGNVCQGQVYQTQSQNNFVHSDGQLVALVGVDDLVVVSTKDALLISSKAQSQQVKEIVQQLKVDQRSELALHREVYRPWGKYDSVDQGNRFQVKRITVKPGAKLSVQMHHHRAEHWIVVSGTALVTIGDKTQYVTENQSVYIPATVIHALENPGNLPLELIEVQSGSYLGEDDIVRFEDRYGRG